jgi:6-phosphogluconolactonase
MTLHRIVSAFLFLGLVISMSVPAQSADAPEKLWAFVGTYTNGKSEGIYVLQLDLKTGALSQKSVIKSDNPSFVAIHPSEKFVYAVNELTTFKGEKSGGVSAYSFDAASGELTFINQQSSKGGAPCHLVVDKTGRNVLLANYVGGSVTVLPINKKKGNLKTPSAFVQHEGSSVSPRQKGPHGHSINVDPKNKFAIAADLGLDQLLVYKFDAKKGTLIANEPAFAKTAAGAGPRHFAFHPSGKAAYVINEMNLTVTAFKYDAKAGKLTETQTISTIPPGLDTKGMSTAEVQVHPSGKFLYGSNRGHHSIVGYKIQDDGKLKYIENTNTGGETPRNFGLDPTGQYLLACNQGTDTIVVFKIDQKTGKLTNTGQEIAVPTPVCVKMMPVR